MRTIQAPKLPVNSGVGGTVLSRTVLSALFCLLFCLFCSALFCSHCFVLHCFVLTVLFCFVLFCLGICGRCEARPKAENIKWKAISEARETLFGFLLQRNISERNVSTAKLLFEIDDLDLREFVELVLDIARLKPHKRRRWKWLHEHCPEILDRVRANPNFDWLVDLASVDGAWPDDLDQFDDHVQTELQKMDDYFPLLQQRRIQAESE